MATLALWAAIILGVLGFLFWLFMQGRSSGKATVAADVAEKTADTLARQDKAGADAAGQDVVDRLRKGGF